MSQVEEFYRGQNVFITGGTGFLGKILFEKLLRSCPDIGTIYLLIRAKKGKSVQERIDALIDDPVLDVLRSYYPDFSKKIVGVAGNVGEEGLGLSIIDRELIVNEVSIIFHLAATIRFNEKLHKAVVVNVNSVKYIVDIAKECKNLMAAIYVSTAYSNCIRKTIDEELYPPPLSYEEVNKLIKDVGEDEWSENEMENYTKRVLKEWPNTYSFTKAIAEGVIAEFAKETQFAIFRPSIVVPTYKEPIPGWLSGVMGLLGMLSATAVGILHVSLVDQDIIFDLVPVDYVCNALITCAWETASSKRRAHDDIPVYNYVSGNKNPITFRRFHRGLEMISRIFPTNAAVYYPSRFTTSSVSIHAVLEFFLHIIPALIIDGFAKILGKKPRMYKLARTMGDAARMCRYFSTQQWDFRNQRVENLWKTIGPKDKQMFPFAIQDLDWDEYMLKLCKGGRKYIFGDRDGNEEEARRRHVYLYIVHTIVRLAFGTIVLWIIWKIFFLHAGS